MPRSLLRLLGLSVAPRRAPAPAPPPKRPRRRKPRVRDFQRARVYRWEALHVFPHAGERLTLGACRALVEQAYRWREAPGGADPSWAPPRVTDGRGRRHACGSREVIKLPRWARTRAVVLHECAHGMADDGHGPKFVGVYAELLEHFAGMDKLALRESLVSAGVAVTAP
jgi:hypothetical protein